MTNADNATSQAGQGGNGQDDVEPRVDYVNPTLRSLAEAFPGSEEEGPELDDQDSHGQ